MAGIIPAGAREASVCGLSSASGDNFNFARFRGTLAAHSEKLAQDEQ